MFHLFYVFLLFKDFFVFVNKVETFLMDKRHMSTLFWVKAVGSEPSLDPGQKAAEDGAAEPWRSG